MCNEFYKVTCNLDILDGDAYLLFLEKWLEKRLKIFFNPIANIIAAQGTKTDNQHQKKDKENKSTHFPVLHHNHPTKIKKTTKTLIYYQCYQGHRIIDCVKFKQKTAIERKNFINEQKLCLNCLSKAHMLRECQLEFRCRLDGCRQKHHTLTHKEP